jgi:hypothetical protein
VRLRLRLLLRLLGGSALLRRRLPVLQRPFCGGGCSRALRRLRRRLLSGGFAEAAALWWRLRRLRRRRRLLEAWRRVGGASLAGASPAPARAMEGVESKLADMAPLPGNESTNEALNRVGGRAGRGPGGGPAVMGVSLTESRPFAVLAPR